MTLWEGKGFFHRPEGVRETEKPIFLQGVPPAAQNQGIAAEDPALLLLCLIQAIWEELLMSISSLIQLRIIKELLLASAMNPLKNLCF